MFDVDQMLPVLSWWLEYLKFELEQVQAQMLEISGIVDTAGAPEAVLEMDADSASASTEAPGDAAAEQESDGFLSDDGLFEKVDAPADEAVPVAQEDPSELVLDVDDAREEPEVVAEQTNGNGQHEPDPLDIL